MATPFIVWTQPLDSPSTVSDPHILRNDLVTISRKAPEGLIDTDGNVIGGQYFARFNDVDRVDNPAVAESGTFGDPGYIAPVSAHSAYTFVDRGHISLEGGAFELLHFSSDVSHSTTVKFTDFSGTVRYIVFVFLCALNRFLCFLNSFERFFFSSSTITK